MEDDDEWETGKGREDVMKMKLGQGTGVCNDPFDLGFQSRQRKMVVKEKR